ncbi:hypothetical protein [Bartonella raoultii]|uniref:hypothetical protein n=1 Tax=Bartonella raoultii TaxID=1457020 RepID=UPI001FEDE6AD|nr:hypothetical protein [Bartonella raoultii]
MLFGRFVVLYGLFATYFGFLSVGVGREAVSTELLWKGATFSCLFGILFGLLHLGVKSLPAVWAVVVKVLAFCCMMGVVLWFFYAGVRDMSGVMVMFLEVLVFALLLKVPVFLLKREGDDSVWQRSLWLVNVVLLSGILGIVLSFVSQGGQNLGLSWLWFSNDKVFIAVGVFILLSLSQGARSILVVGKAFLKRVGGHSR